MRVLLIQEQIVSTPEILFEQAADFEEALYLLKEFDYDSIVFDFFKAKAAAETFLKMISKNQSTIPIIIVSEQQSLENKKLAFDSGVDDFLGKPYEVEELYLRLRALMRRKHGIQGHLIRVEKLVADLNARTCFVGKNPLPLTSKEYQLLEFMLLRQNHILSRDKITRDLYPEEKEQASNVIDVLMSKIRKKLELAGMPSLIQTIRGEGYTIRNHLG